MNKKRIFISHSAKGGDAEAVQSALVRALDSDRFAVLLDKVSLEPGDLWRARINLWVGGCDAAVILLSADALRSPYVIYEASLLSYRSSMDPSFLLIPIFLDDIDPENLRRSYLHPAQLNEKQGVRGTPEEIVSKVVERLEKAVQVGSTPIERRAKHLANQLGIFRDEHLLEVADQLDLDLRQWLPGENVKLRLAVQLLSIGMVASIPAILGLRSYLLKGLSWKTTQRWVEETVELIASSWVDLRSVDRIPRIAKGKETVRAIGVNACERFTAQMYVLCASRDDIQGTWYFVECDGITGEDAAEALKDKVRRLLVRKLDTTLDKLEKVLSVLDQTGQPVLVSLPGESFDDDLLAKLRHAFPTVTFFLLMGETFEQEASVSDSLLEILFPQLGSGDEAAFLEQYDFLWEGVRPRKNQRGTRR